MQCPLRRVLGASQVQSVGKPALGALSTLEIDFMDRT
jgi:hypothetical protein